ncbi:uncharacterized protein ATC70_011839 [Mucor velutinosus]|uniref:Uncharacterized protein n=1 Tax=Mucor velutinosus TaxID=708070 RepID=A0AAN7D950_9FUNG|nr:hypothetical protein ATC70_011839 [Mucor velutinosus]
MNSQQQQQQASTGHGTVDVPWTEDSKSSLQDNQGISSSSAASQSQKSHQQHQNSAPEKEHIGFGHATQHQHSPRSIKRDLNDI